MPDAIHPSAASRPDRLNATGPADNIRSNAPPSAAGIAQRPAGRGHHGLPARAVPTGSWPRPFAKKIPLHRQLADFLIQWGHQGLVHRRAIGRAGVIPRANNDAVPSSKVFFQPWIWLAWTPNRLDSSATVPSSRTAASATFALNSALCFFRVLVISHLRPTGRSKGRLSLSNLSSFRRPPHSSAL